ncbi:hypothetical protein J7K74_01960 [Candidatus Woesearchaeota archaeon]|nr:hypothetical protein [Candidatus Woesearchaeota archaeon]
MGKKGLMTLMGLAFLIALIEIQTYAYENNDTNNNLSINIINSSINESYNESFYNNQSNQREPINNISLFGRIVEVYPNPPGSDSMSEWIEVIIPLEMLMNNSIGIIVGDSSRNVSLSRIRINCSVVIISERNDSNYSCSILSANGLIGNGLNNNGDSLYLYYEINGSKTLIDTFSYGKVDEGMSIKRINESILISPPTPCMLDTLNESNIDNSNNSINQSMNNTINETYNESYSEENESNTKNNCSISITLDKDIYEQGEKIKYKIKTNEWPVVYWIEDLYGNILKEKRNTTSSGEKSYTPRFIEEKALVIRASNKCGNTSRLVVVKKGLQAETKRDEISIEKIKLDEDLLGLEYYIYRSNTSKTLVEARVECEKEKTTILKTYLDKYSGARIRIDIPIEMCGDCNLSIHGLGIEKVEKINIPCKKDEDEKPRERLSIESIEMDSSALRVKTTQDVFLRSGSLLFLSRREKDWNIFNGSYYNKKYSICLMNTSDCMSIKISPLFEKKISCSGGSDMNNSITGMTVSNESSGNHNISIISYGIVGITSLFFLKKLLKK